MATDDTGTNVEQNTEPADNGSAAKEWRANLPENLRDNEMLADIPDIGNLAQKFVETNELLSSNSVPENPDDYAIELGDGVDMPEEKVKLLKKMAHESGMPNEVLNKFLAQSVKVQKQAAEEKQIAEDEQIRKFKAELGDKFDSTVNSAAQLLGKFGGKELAEELSTNRLGNSPELIKALAGISEHIADDSFEGGESPASSPFVDEHGARSIKFNM